MIREIDARILQDWLAQKKPVTVLDIRQARDRDQWWIPESLHVDAYDSLKAGVPGLLENVILPQGQPVVTVCGSGRVSLKAAEALSEMRGLPALSLRGGMRAWSLAWNTATHSFGPVEVTQIRRTGKGCLSYLIRSGSEAAVIDPSVAPEVYLSLAGDKGARIQHVLETHIHADHLSRARLLAERSGAELVLPRQNRVRYRHTTVTEGDKLFAGGVSIAVLSTPGHTDESTTYLLPGAGIFTGDALFLTGVGRPDLHAAGMEAEARSRRLYNSLRKLTSLDPRLLVFPGHTSEPVPFDEAILTASVGEVTSRLGDWLSSEQEFVNRILERIPETPPNYLVISQINESGEWPDSDPTELEAGANRCAAR